MVELPMSRCPDDETLAAWVDGRLRNSETTALIEHASVCERCIAMLDAANETFHAEAPGVPARPDAGWRRWMLAVAALVVLAVTALLVVRSQRSDPLRELVEVAPRSARPVEARLSGGFPWAPYRGSMRANGAESGTDEMKLIGAAAEALERAERDPSSREAQRAAAVAAVLIGRAEEGVTRLAAQAKASPNEASAWNDLAAAQYAAALAGRTSFLGEALASANRALRIDPRQGEALFNRALILERLALRDEARTAWQRYLDTDASSPWAAEAREHLARLGAGAAMRRFEEERERLETASAAGDVVQVRALIARHGERARAYAEVEYLGRWAAALQRDSGPEATRWLTIARSIGVALEEASGESLLRDAVRAIESADATRRARIADAHLVYREGRIAFSRRALSDAERDLRRAAIAFTAAGDPMALAARSYAAGARLAQNDVAHARRELTQLMPEVDASAGYLSLAGQVRWELARALMFDGDWSGGARLLVEAEERFRRAGERVNEATIGAMLAETLIAAGRPDDAWRAQIRAFATLGNARRNDLLDAVISNAATTALRAGRDETARALIAINERLERELANDLLLADTLVRKSLLDADHDPAAAVRSAEEAATVAMRIPDASLRARHLADADFAMAAALVASNPKRSRELASRAIDLYGSTGMVALQAEPYLVRARASLKLDDAAAAQLDLAAGIAAVEHHPLRIAGAVIGTGVLDAGNALFEEAIRLDLARGDVAAAFAHAERRRGVAADEHALGELRKRLAGSGTAVLAMIVLPREVVSLAITEHAATAARHAIGREELATLAARDDDASAARLYDLLIRPVAGAIGDVRALIVIPDELLERVPFAALGDGKRALVERMAVAIAPSAMALRAESAGRAPSRIAAVGLPSGRGVGSAALPEAEIELTEIGALYRNVDRVDARDVSPRAVEESASAADVLHIAGHTEGEATTAGEALASAGDAISWRTIAAMREMPRVVVLSACNTLRRPHDADRRALSLAGAFVAAGARDVVGTLAPIGDADARSLFLALHEQLARGVAPPAALRHVQLAQRQKPGGAWRRLALLTTTIHRND